MEAFVVLSSSCHGGISGIRGHESLGDEPYYGLLGENAVVLINAMVWEDIGVSNPN